MHSNWHQCLTKSIYQRIHRESYILKFDQPPSLKINSYSPSSPPTTLSSLSSQPFIFLRHWSPTRLSIPIVDCSIARHQFLCSSLVTLLPNLSSSSIVGCRFVFQYPLLIVPLLVARWVSSIFLGWCLDIWYFIVYAESNFVVSERHCQLHGK